MHQLENQHLQVLYRGHVRHISAGESVPARVGTLQRLCCWNVLSDLRVGLRRVWVEIDK
ncbi:hypothetical protein AHAS_Ahas16G0189900 [Arachis hypogaea]